MSKTNIIGILLLFIMAVSYCLIIKNNELQQELLGLRQSNESLQQSYFQTTEKVKYLQQNYYELTERVSFFEESLSTKNYKFTMMKKIRKAIYDSAGDNLRLKFNLFDLTDVANAVLEYSNKYDIPVSLILAMMRQESAFNKSALSRVGATGLMQVMPQTAQEIGKELDKKNYNITSINDNVHFGIYYIRKMLKKYKGDVSMAVRAYNAGPEFVDKVNNKIYENYPKETITYHEKVLQYKKLYESLGL